MMMMMMKLVLKLLTKLELATYDRRLHVPQVNNSMSKQVRKVLWTRKAPACLHTVYTYICTYCIYAYDTPRLCMNIHYYAPRLSPTGRLQPTDTKLQTVGCILVKVKCQVLNR